MKNYFVTAKTYMVDHKKDFTIGTSIFIVVALVIALIIFIANNVDHPATIVYQPAKACELFTAAEAQELLGDKAINSGTSDLILSGNTTTSKCGYADGNPNMNSAVVAAIIVRSGINDAGVTQNKTEFVNGTPTQNVETVNNLGDKAYFNQKLGQLNVLDGRDWIIFSYGVGADPTGNTLSDAIKLAHIVIRSNS
jgi:hypothetical protein